MIINMFKNSETFKKIYNNSKNLYKIDLYIVGKKMIKKGKTKEKFKKKNITDKNKAIKFLNKQKIAENLYYTYAYSLSNELKTNKDIYEMLKEKFIFNEDELFENYARDFVHEYGESCGKSHNKEKINDALSEIKQFIFSEKSLYAYWMFYSLDSKCNIPFKDYYEVYNMFEKEDTIQGYLIGEFTHRGKRSRTGSVYIKLLEKTGDECLKHNYHMILTRWYYNKDVYDYLLKRGIEKEKLDKQVNEYIERYETLKEKAQSGNLDDDEKMDYRKYIALYYRVIRGNYDEKDPVYNYFKAKKEMNYINDDNPYKGYIKSESKRLQKEFEQSVIENKPFCQPTCKKVGDQRSIIEYLDEKSNTHLALIKPSEEETVKRLEAEIDINGDSGKTIQQTSEHVQKKFGITKESFHQSYIDSKGFNTTMNSSCNVDPAIEEFIENGSVKKLTKKQ